MAILMTIKLVKFTKIMAEILEKSHKKSVYDCSTHFRNPLFIMVSKKDKVNDCITNLSNVNTYNFHNTLWNKGKLATG